MGGFAFFLLFVALVVVVGGALTVIMISLFRRVFSREED